MDIISSTGFQFNNAVITDIIKIATHINSEGDIITLQNLLAESKENLILIGMGEKGAVTRIEFPKLGSKLTFCSAQLNTAPGQISLEEMVRQIS